MKVIPTPIKDLIIIDPKPHHDERGFFFEAFQSERYQRLLKKKIKLP